MPLQATLPLVSVPVSLPAARPARKKPTDPRRDLRLRLVRARRPGAPILVGSAAAPYIPGDADGSPFAALLGCEGLEVGIVTRSPEILRDLDLLVELDRRHAVTVDLVLASVDPFLARRLEPRSEREAAEPHARLRAAARLAAEGIAVRFLCTPLLPGVNDTERVLRPLFAAAREAGAQDVLTAPAPSSRLGRLFGRAPSRPAQLGAFHLLRLEYGFPLAVAGRG